MIVKGTIIGERYEVLDQIGSGGMSDVYKALDSTLGRNVAIKVLKAEFCEDMTFVAKFRAEAQAAAGLEHPNIVNVYDVGSQDGFHYIVMEYVEGITLKTYISKKGKLNYKETLSIAIQVGRGIQAAHTKNVIHRDIKPQNIVISREGKVKVTDFGIARAVSENTIHSDVIGSVHYSSPEQTRNGYVSNRSDIYSLGIVMYEMVTGRVPYDGDSTVTIAIKHLQDEMVSPKVYAEDLPISLEKIILKCTQKSPDRRYDSMDSLLIDLRKSLLNPHDDFVDLVPFSQGKTRVLSTEEVQEIQDKTSAIKPIPTPAPGPSSTKRPPAYKPPVFDDDYEDDDEYDEDDDEFLNSKLDKAVGVMKIVILIIIIAIVAYIILSFFGIIKFSFGNFGDMFKKNKTESSQTVDTDYVEMIKITDMKEEEAKEALEKLGLSLHTTEEYTTAYEPGIIFEQDWAEGKQVPIGQVIEAKVATDVEGPSTEEAVEATVPDVKGMSSDKAMNFLKEKGFVPSREFQYSSDVATGTVIKQSPEANTKGKTGDKVTIYVSQGNESTQVPSVKGMTEAEARNALGNKGLNVGSVTQDYSDSVPAGQVMSQSVAANKYVDMGTSVNLVVSMGTKEVSYYIKSQITAPTNVTVQSADIELTPSESDQTLGSWNGVTSFPFVVEVHNIKDVPSGTLTIVWHYTDENGNVGESIQEKEVTFRQE